MGTEQTPYYDFLIIKYYIFISTCTYMYYNRVSWPSGLEHRTQALVLLFNRVWVQIPVVTLVSLSKALNYNCFSPPRGKWVPVRAEMVLVIDLAE